MNNTTFNASSDAEVISSSIYRILKDSDYTLSLFTENEITNLKNRIEWRSSKSEKKPFIKCIVRNKLIQLKPEEFVRQLYTERLIRDYNYSVSRMVFEYPVIFGKEKKKADIVIFDKDQPDSPYIIIELKKPKLNEGKGQLRSYCNATGAQMGIWTNGGLISHYHRKDPNYFEEISEIPKSNQTLAEILKERFTMKDLLIKDKLANTRISLKGLILEMENEVLANAGVDVFEEVFKLIFTKLYDEKLSSDDKTKLDGFLEQIHADGVGRDFEEIKNSLREYNDNNFRLMEFRNSGQTDTKLKSKIQKLFFDAQKEWPGVFPSETNFELTDSHLAICVASLQDVKLFNSNLLVIDEAFEYLVGKSSKGEKGQYFTPRHVIDMCVKMLNPLKGEYMIDTASGSGGFPVHTYFKLNGRLFNNSNNFDTSVEDKNNVLRIFGIDFDEKTVRVSRTLNLIAGDGETNVLHLNSLDFERWKDKTEKDMRWRDTYGKGFRRLEKLRAEKNENRRFNFDIVMANPPFAGDIKESRILHKYHLSTGSDGKWKRKVARDILFVERNIDFLKPGGRMAIVLPQGRFNNKTDKYIRDYIAEHVRILAVISLHINTFKPHTGTKTSVLLIQKWDPSLCPKVDDYPIFFAVSEKSGKDNSGDYVYLKDEYGQEKLDKNRHLIVDHDLHNHENHLPDGIAEAFVNWAQKEELSFWK